MKVNKWKIKKCLVTKHGMTCIEKPMPDLIYYISRYCILRLCEELIKESFYNLKLLKNNSDYLNDILI
tara:strand:+ start:2338 stop:2541 length:204 start_codon:yes stop_codon:yes gene_type:complete